jgi:membrane fusion protein, macrolide-specific efflux system
MLNDDGAGATEQPQSAVPSTTNAEAQPLEVSQGSLLVPPPEPQVDRPLVAPVAPRADAKRVALIVCIVLVVLLAFVIQRSLSGGGSKKTPQSLATASLRSFPVVVSATGTVVPAGELSLNFSVSGQITEIDVKVGDPVASGAVLAKVDATFAQAEVSEAQGEISSATNPSALAQAKGALAKGQADLALTVLHAPAAGTIEAINGQVGETVPTVATAAPTLPGLGAPIPPALGTGTASSTGNVPFIEVDTGTGIVVGVTLSSTDVPQVAANQKCQLTSQTITGLSLPCHVLARASDATIVNGLPQYFATIIPDGTDSRLLNGMPVNVQISVANATNVLAVPNSAVYILDGAPHVDVWFKHHAVATVVTTGLVGEDLTQVKSGLTNGQQVIVTAPNGLPPAPPTTSP